MNLKRDTSKFFQVTERIFQFDNYREFLKEYFKEQKELKSVFSHRYFARKAGFNSASFCSHLISGKRNITEKSIPKLIKGIGLKGKPALYLEYMILFNQADSHSEREHYYNQLNRVRKSSKFYKLNEKHFPLFNEWYIPVVRELVAYAKWQGDFERLGKMLRPPIKTTEAQRAVEVLLNCGLLTQDSKGNYQQSNPVISAEKIPHSILQNYKKQNLLRALDVTESMGLSERHISSATVSMSEKTYNEITQLIDETRKKIMEKAQNDKHIEKVYQINFQAFPLSKKIED